MKKVRTAALRVAESGGDVLHEIRGAVTDGDGDLPYGGFPPRFDIQLWVINFVCGGVLPREVRAEVDIPFEAGAGCGLESWSVRNWTELKSKTEEGTEVGWGAFDGGEVVVGDMGRPIEVKPRRHGGQAEVCVVAD